MKEKLWLTLVTCLAYCIDKTRFTWGVKALPWLILTDKQHTVRAEGFNINELDDKITTLRKKQGAFEKN